MTYGGSISDKQLTLDSVCLDLVEPYTEIMVDKGFNIKEECVSNSSRKSWAVANDAIGY